MMVLFDAYFGSISQPGAAHLQVLSSSIPLTNWLNDSASPIASSRLTSPKICRSSFALLYTRSICMASLDRLVRASRPSLSSYLAAASFIIPTLQDCSLRPLHHRYCALHFSARLISGMDKMSSLPSMITLNLSIRKNWLLSALHFVCFQAQI